MRNAGRQSHGTAAQEPTCTKCGGQRSSRRGKWGAAPRAVGGAEEGERVSRGFWAQEIFGGRQTSPSLRRQPRSPVALRSTWGARVGANGAGREVGLVQLFTKRGTVRTAGREHPPHASDPESESVLRDHQETRAQRAMAMSTGLRSGRARVSAGEGRDTREKRVPRVRSPLPQPPRLEVG